MDGTGIEKIVGVTVTTVDDSPVNNLLAISPLNGSSILEDTTQVWTLAYTDVEGDMASACNVQYNTVNLSLQTNCACTAAGICTFAIRGKETDFFGNGEFFTYQVYANGKWSSPTTVFFDIVAVNDAPTLNATVSFTVLEDSVASNIYVGSGTGDGAGFVNGSGIGSGSDGDNIASTLSYSVFSGPSGGTFLACMDSSRYSVAMT